MFVLGHAALGTALVRKTVPKSPLVAIVVGALLPDLVDKPLYYGFYYCSRWFGSGAHGAGLGLISGTRTVGHTALFLLAIVAVAAIRKSRAWWGVAAGVTSHLFLDNLGDAFGTGPHEGPSTFDCLIFPLHGFRFPVSAFGSVGDHVRSFAHGYILAGEIIGFLVLVWWLIARKGRQRSSGDIDIS